MILRNSLLICLVLVSSCGKMSKVQFVEVDKQRCDSLFDKQDNIIIVSCVRCGCFNKSLSDAYKADSAFFKQIYLVADTACGKFRFIPHHVSQSALDSLNDDLYNLTLIKRTPTGFSGRIVETKESIKLLSVCKSFFK